MTNRNHRGWLLVAVAVVGLALAVATVSAHDTERTQGSEMAPGTMPADSNAGVGPAWMTDHVGAIEDMGPHVGATVDEMHDSPHHAGGTPGQGHGCR